MTDDNGSDAPARCLVIALGALCLLCPWASTPMLSLGFCLLLLAAAALVLLSLTRPLKRTWVSEIPLLWMISAVVVIGVLLSAGMCLAGDVNLLVLGVTTSVVLVSAMSVVHAAHPSRGAALVCAMSTALLFFLYVSSWSRVIDVKDFLAGGIEAILSGASPYAITVNNVYDTQMTGQLYGPDIAADGRVLFGYAYLPAPLFLDLPSYMAGEVRWMHALALAIAVWIMWRLASDRLGRAAAVVLALAPSTPFVIANYWVEPLMIASLALVVWGLHRRVRSRVAAGLAVFFSSKQYAIFLVPALWTAARSAGWRVAVAGIVAAACLVIPLAMLDVHAFFRSAVTFQVVLPFREDAVSFLPAVRDLGGDLPSWLYVVLPFAGCVVASFVARVTRPGPTAFALCVGLGLLVTVMVSKQSFTNYYSLIGASLLFAGVTWPVDDPLRPRARSNRELSCGAS